jgi:hypothetical protein
VSDLRFEFGSNNWSGRKRPSPVGISTAMPDRLDEWFHHATDHTPPPTRMLQVAFAGRFHTIVRRLIIRFPYLVQNPPEQLDCAADQERRLQRLQEILDELMTITDWKKP